MKHRIFTLVTIAVLSLVFTAGCSSSKKEKKSAKAADEKTKTVVAAPAAPVLNALSSDQMDYTTIEFDRGEAKLSEMDFRNINNLLTETTQAGKIVQDVKVLTWSDRAVTKNEEATNTEIFLARQRADNIQKYLNSKKKKKKQTDFYNMAENPERYSEYMKEKGVNLEDAFKVEGTKETPDSHALVIIEYKGGPMPSTL
jgi:hypothetical protein